MGEVQGLRERKKQRTRKAITDAAMRLFAEHGFERTTIADIADASDIAPRTFFAYFRSKEEVVFADFQDSFDALGARLRDRLPDESALDAMRAWIATVIDLLGAPDEMAELRKRLICDSDALAAHDRHLASRFEGLLAEAVAEDLGEAPDALRPRMVAAAAVAALYALEDHPGGGSGDPLQQVDTALVFLRGGLAALQDAG